MLPRAGKMDKAERCLAWEPSRSIMRNSDKSHCARRSRPQEPESLHAYLYKTSKAYFPYLMNFHRDIADTAIGRPENTSK
jgi:hypothetical protein